MFGISGGNWSHSSSLVSKWFTVDSHARAWNLILKISGHGQLMHYCACMSSTEQTCVPIRET